MIEMKDLEIYFYLVVLFDIVVLICYFFLCDNVYRIKKKMEPSNEFGAVFSLLISTGQKEEAKKLLLNEIMKDKDFTFAFFAGGDRTEVRTAIMGKYKAYLDMVGMDVDFSKTDELIKRTSL